MPALFNLPYADVGQGIIPSDGALLYFYDVDGVTPKNTWENYAMSVLNSNPVESDADGIFPAIWISGDYSVTLKDKNGVQIWNAPYVTSTSGVATVTQVSDYSSFGTYYEDSGVADAYILTNPEGLVPPELVDGQYQEGMLIRFTVNNANTGTCAVEVASGPSVKFRTVSDTNLAANDLLADGTEYFASFRAAYDSGNGAFMIVSSSGGGNYVLKSGDTMTGALNMSGAAVNMAWGATIASASSINLETATGNCVYISGSSTISSITLDDGHIRWVLFLGAATLVHSSVLLLPGGANITAAQNDIACFVGDTIGVTRCVTYSRYSGVPVSGLGIGQTYHDVTASRVAGTTYTNSRSVPIGIYVKVDGSDTGVGVTVSGSQVSVSSTAGATGNDVNSASAIVPAGATYSVQNYGGTLTWFELY